MRQAILTALASAAAERNGVNKRLQNTGVQAAHIFGNETDMIGHDPEEADLLRAYEQQMKYASQRLRQLDQQIQTLERLDLHLSELFPDHDAAVSPPTTVPASAS